MRTLNFLGLDETGLSPETADVLIQPIPYDSTTSFQPGTRFGPEAILQASSQVELWDEELDWEPMAHRTCLTLSDIPRNHHSPEMMIRDIDEHMRPFWKQKKMILALGGEHTVAFPLVRGVKRSYPDPVVLVLDAHADLRESWEGSSFSHACTLKRIAELDCPIFHLGLRSLSKEEQKYLKGQSLIRSYSSPEILFNNGLDRFRHDLTAMADRNFYLSLDIDVLDPSLVPGTGTPEPGGLTWHHLMHIFKIIVSQGPIRGIDVCELMPLPGSRLSEFVAAKLIFKLLSYLFYPTKKENPYVRS
ncbi:MAG: agmatinase [Deltaproteobacteria bacterium RBG_13_43_22]|nr:MAG: agmatinase [Deltaproteobacteria bacterium RBG_13_43_22]